MRALTPASGPQYSSRIIKAGSLLADSRVYLREWDEGRSARENLAHFREVNVLGKRSRSRAEDVLAELRRRFPLESPDGGPGHALLRFVKETPSPKAVDRVLAYHAAKSDPLLYDFITIHLARLHERGERRVTVIDALTFLRESARRSATTRTWSSVTLNALAKALLAASKDFALVSGRTRKVLTTPGLPLEAFLYIAYRLRRHAHGFSLLAHRDWRLFLLAPENVEHLAITAARQELLTYEALGQTASIGFPYSDLDALLNVIAR